MQLLRGEIKRLARVGDDRTRHHRSRRRHHRQTRDILGADGEIHLRQLALAAAPATARLHLVASRRDVGDGEGARLIDASATATLLHHDAASRGGAAWQQHHGAARGRRARRGQHLAGEPNQLGGDQAERDGRVLLRHRQRDARRFRDVRGAGEVGRGIARHFTGGVGCFGTTRTQGGADEVLAGRQSEQAIVALVVSGVTRVRAGRGGKTPATRGVAVAHGEHAGVGDGFAELVGDASPEHAAARERDQ